MQGAIPPRRSAAWNAASQAMRQTIRCGRPPFLPTGNTWRFPTKMGCFSAVLASGETQNVAIADDLRTGPVMLNVTLSGKVIPALEEKEMDLGWAIPFPNGRDVAIWMSAASSNVYLLEDF